MLKSKQIAVYGAGGSGREVAWLISRLGEADRFEFVGYVDDHCGISRLVSGSPVFTLKDFVSHYPDASIALGVGDPGVRKSLAKKCQKRGVALESLVDPSVQISDRVVIGEGAIICASSVVTVDIRIANFVQINYGCTIAHDVRIGAYSTISPGVNVSGNVHIGEGVFIGTGASIVNGTPTTPIVLEDGCLIAAGACVTGSAKARSLYAGVPARFKKTLT